MRRGLSNTMQVAPFACSWMNLPPTCFFCLNASQEGSVVTFCGYCPSSSSCPAYRLLRAHMNRASPHKRSHIMADITHGSRRYSFAGQRAVIFGRCVIWQRTKQAKSFPLFKVTQKCHHLWNPCLSYLSPQHVNAPVKFFTSEQRSLHNWPALFSVCVRVWFHNKMHCDGNTLSYASRHARHVIIKHSKVFV